MKSIKNISAFILTSLSLVLGYAGMVLIFCAVVGVILAVLVYAFVFTFLEPSWAAVPLDIAIIAILFFFLDQNDLKIAFEKLGNRFLGICK